MTLPSTVVQASASGPMLSSEHDLRVEQARFTFFTCWSMFLMISSEQMG
jgi:hypothetical protein